MKPDKSPKVDMDAAIDRAVRSIMSAEPRPGMRQRVLSRINETPQRRVSVLRLAIAGGSIAVVAVAVMLRVADWPAVREEHPAAPPVTATRPSPKEAGPEPPRPIAPAGPSRRSTTPLQPVPRGLVVAQSLAVPDMEDPVVRTPEAAADLPAALEPVRTPVLSPIQRLDLSPATVPAITMAPLGISELQDIAPLQGSIR